MKYKKPLLAFAALGVFTFAGLSAPSASAIEYETIQKTIPCSTDVYKVDQDYSAEYFVTYYVEGGCYGENITFDLNGKKVEDGTIFYSNITLQDTGETAGYFKNISRHTEENVPTHQKNVITMGGSGGSVAKIKSGVFSGNIEVDGPAVIEGGTISGSINATSSASLTISGGNIDVAISGEGNISISGGTFSAKPDEKYLSPGYATYEVTGKYVVDRSFMLTNFFQYMYVGQSSKAYISPGRIAKTAEVTSSDESILGIACEDSTIIPGQMMIKTNDGSIGSKACTLTAKKAGKATISYTTDYNYNGSITVYAADIDAAAYGDSAENAKYALTAHDLSLYVAEPLEHSWLSTAPSAVGPGYDLDALKKKYAGVADAVKAGHGLRLTLEFNEATLTDAEKKLIEGVPNGNNIAAAYSPVGSVVDITTGKSLVDQVYSFSTLPLPEILKNRSRTIQVVNLAENTNGQYGISAPFSASIEDGKLHFDVGAYYYYGYYGSKMVVLYDGEPITSGSLPDATPKAPNTSSQPESVAIILGASAAIGLPLISVIIYLARRKTIARKLRF